VTARLVANPLWVTASRIGHQLHLDPRVVADAPLPEWLLLLAAARICQADQEAYDLAKAKAYGGG
jgi:hypothetical protein